MHAVWLRLTDYILRVGDFAHENSFFFFMLLLFFWRFANVHPIVLTVQCCSISKIPAILLCKMHNRFLLAIITFVPVWSWVRQGARCLSHCTVFTFCNCTNKLSRHRSYTTGCSVRRLIRVCMYETHQLVVKYFFPLFWTSMARKFRCPYILAH